MELNFSKNELGLEGAKKLASRLPKMKKLKTLVLANCNMGDRGCIEVVTAFEDLSVDYLDLSGN
jgi:Ran GTPase-activating protein (RanGAP) involved in mRNA processing and transport